jgi:hypothetical protein
MKGICPKCQLAVGKAIPGATVWCPCNKTGAIFVNMDGYKFWMLYSGVDRAVFEVAAANIKTAAPIISAGVAEAKKNIVSNPTHD